MLVFRGVHKLYPTHVFFLGFDVFPFRRTGQSVGLVGPSGGGAGDLPGRVCYMDVSKNRGTPEWMVYNGKPY